MNYRIWKFPLSIVDFQTVAIPDGRVLSVQFQDGELRLWAMVDPTKASRLLEIVIVGTGNPCYYMDGWTFQATCQDQRGFVWHVFTKWKPES